MANHNSSNRSNPNSTSLWESALRELAAKPEVDPKEVENLDTIVRSFLGGAPTNEVVKKLYYKIMHGAEEDFLEEQEEQEE